MTNVFSNSRVDFLARGVIKAMLELGIDPATYPFVFRSAGAFEEDAYAILRKYGVKYLGRATTFEDAAKDAIRMMGAVEATRYHPSVSSVTRHATMAFAAGCRTIFPENLTHEKKAHRE